MKMTSLKLNTRNQMPKIWKGVRAYRPIVTHWISSLLPGLQIFPRIFSFYISMQTEKKMLKVREKFLWNSFNCRAECSAEQIPTFFLPIPTYWSCIGIWVGMNQSVRIGIFSVSFWTSHSLVWYELINRYNCILSALAIYSPCNIQPLQYPAIQINSNK